MLFTSFSKGVLSPALYGRSDIQNYYQAAETLQNFDLIPTGGIRKRGGAVQRAGAWGAAKTIPFIVSRELTYFVVYVAGQGWYWRNGPNTTNRALGQSNAYYTGLAAADIERLQWAQTGSRMYIACQAAPLLRIDYTGGGLAGTIPVFDRNSQIVKVGAYDKSRPDEPDPSAPELTIAEPLNTLGAPDTYPAAVAFFAGRLVFGGTRANPQKLYASMAGNIAADNTTVDGETKFNTYNKIRQVNREYTTVVGQLIKGKPYIILETLENIGQVLGHPVNEYMIDSPLYFPAGTQALGLGPVDDEKGSKVPGILTSKPALEGGIIASGTLQSYDGTAWNTLAATDEELAQMTDEEKNKDFQYSAKKFGVNLDLGTIVADGIVTIFRMYYDRDWWNSFVKYTTPEDWFNSGEFSDLYGRKTGTGAPGNIEIARGVFEAIGRYMGVHFVAGGAGLQQIYGYLYPDIISQIQNIVGDFKHTNIVLYWESISTEIQVKQVTAENAFAITLKSESNDAIQWLSNNSGLIIGTTMGEWIIPPGVDATNVTSAVYLNSHYGSARLRPQSLGLATLFLSPARNRLLEYYIPERDTNFRMNDLAMLCPEILAGAKEVAAQIVPYPRVYVLRNNGDISVLFYETGSGTKGWVTYHFTEPVIDIFVTPDADDEALNIVTASGLYQLQESQSFDGAPGGARRDIECVYRSVPILTGVDFAKKRIVRLNLRCYKSNLQKSSIINVQTGLKNPVVIQPQQNAKSMQILKQPFPGSFDDDVQVEIADTSQNPLTILVIDAEAV